jgi:hypothetical protein
VVPGRFPLQLLPHSRSMKMCQSMLYRFMMETKSAIALPEGVKLPPIPLHS